MKYLLILITATIITSCASITQGTTQLLSFSIDPVEATCKVFTDDGTQIGSISGKQNMIQVSKDNSDILVKCSSEGYQDSTTRIVSTTQTAGVIGVSIDLGITDMLTGAMWKYPSHTNIVLEK